MRLLKIGSEIYNLDQLVKYEEIRRQELKSDYQQEYGFFNEPLDPRTDQMREALYVRLHFADGDGPLLDEALSARFLAYVAEQRLTIATLDQAEAG